MWGCVFSVYPFPLWWLREYMYIYIYILCLIIIIKSEVWTITHCLELGHETMVSAVCLSTFFWFHAVFDVRIIFEKKPDRVQVILCMGNNLYPQKITNYSFLWIWCDAPFYQYRSLDGLHLRIAALFVITCYNLQHLKHKEFQWYYDQLANTAIDKLMHRDNENNGNGYDSIWISMSGILNTPNETQWKIYSKGANGNKAVTSIL